MKPFTLSVKLTTYIMLLCFSLYILSYYQNNKCLNILIGCFVLKDQAAYSMYTIDFLDFGSLLWEMVNIKSMFSGHFWKVLAFTSYVI